MSWNLDEQKKFLDEQCRTYGAHYLATDPLKFVHRFNRGRDLACLFWWLRQILESHGSLEAFFLEGYKEDDPTVRPALTSFVERMLALDTHVIRAARKLQLSVRKTPNWKMAEEITRRLKKLDPADPLKYDFSLCRLGMMRHWPTKRQAYIKL